MAAPITSKTEVKIIRVLELYSGIGGMHFSLKETGLEFKVVQAIDVNTNANEIYRLNFPETHVSSCGIEGLTVKSLDKLDIDMILMSPPCQPFTRIGKKQDTLDPRTRSFLHLLELIPRLKKYPSYILLENVKGFEASETRDRLIEMLEKCNYVYQEFLLTPLQFGIPNSRLRYYIIAKQTPCKFSFERTEKIMDDIPVVAANWLKYRLLAETTQQHCVCAGYHGESIRIPVATETSSDLTEASTVMTKTNSVCTKESSSVSDTQLNYVEERLAEENDQTADKDRLHLKIFPDFVSDVKCVKVSESDSLHGCTCNVNLNNSSDDVDNKSETHTCVKRLKRDSDIQPTVCGQGRRLEETISDEGSDTKSSNAKCTASASTDTKPNEFCLENFGFNMRQEENQEKLGPCLGLNHFMEENKDVDFFKPYLLPDNMLQHFIVMDIINPCSRKSTCFTKGYGKFVTGTGSVVQVTKDIQLMKQASMLKDQAVSDRDQVQWNESELGVIRSLQLRYCTPREVANILCFPKSFNFPDTFTNRQLYMLLGNSLNVHVVSVLIQLMVAEDTN